MRGMPQAAAAASAAASARSTASESDERRSERSKQCEGMALRREPMVKGGASVGWRSDGSPVRGRLEAFSSLSLLLLTEEEGFFSSPSAAAAAVASFAEAISFAAAPRPLRLGTL